MNQLLNRLEKQIAHTGDQTMKCFVSDDGGDAQRVLLASLDFFERESERARRIQEANGAGNVLFVRFGAILVEDTLEPARVLGLRLAERVHHQEAALALASMGRKAFEPLSQQLTSTNATARRNAAWAIGELTNMIPGERSGAVSQLITLLGDSDAWVRMAAARALGEVRDERAVTRLVATLSDENWRVREVVVWALSEMKDDRAVNALCSVMLSDVRVEVRRGAAEALGEIASAGALPSLKQALNDTEPSVSAKAAWAISEIEG